MMRPRLFQSLLMLFAAVLLATGPSSPTCAAAAATRIDGPAMAGCDMSGPAKSTSHPAHPDCASPCIGIACLVPNIAPISSEKFIPSDTAMARLDGLDAPPEAEPPRS